MSTALWIAASCLGFLALVYLFQDRLLYFPQRATVEQAVSAGLSPWPTAQEFRGLVAEPTSAVGAEGAVGVVRGTVIVFHGNAGHVGEDRQFKRPSSHPSSSRHTPRRALGRATVWLLGAAVAR